MHNAIESKRGKEREGERDLCDRKCLGLNFRSNFRRFPFNASSIAKGSERGEREKERERKRVHFSKWLLAHKLRALFRARERERERERSARMKCK